MVKSMNSQEKILAFFAANRGEKPSINQLAKRLGLNYRLAFEAVRGLGKEGLLSVEKLGNFNRCGFVWKFCPASLAAEVRRRDGLLKDRNLAVMAGRLSSIRNPFHIMLVFGSWASGTQKKGSDVDLCVISDDPRAIEEAETVAGGMPFDVHMLDFSHGEFLSMLGTARQNVGKEIVGNCVILNGTEAFYRMAGELNFPV